MCKRNASWWMILSCWSCAVCTAWAQPPSVAPPPLRRLPEVETPAEVISPAGPGGEVAPDPGMAYPSERRPGSGPLVWWNNRLKPALQYKYWGYPEEFEEIPLGVRLRAVQRAQICNGQAARLWLYRYDFCDEGPGLNPAGDKRLRELAGEFSVWAYHPVVIESSGKPELDAARRAHVIQRLEALGAPAQVVVDVSRVAAPFGDETRWWYQRFERQVQAGGGAAATAGTGGSFQPATQ